MSTLTQLPAWHALWDHFNDAKNLHMRELFDSDPQRAERYSLEVGGLFLDYSKNRITDATLQGLMQHAPEETGDILVFLPGQSEIERLSALLGPPAGTVDRLLRTPSPTMFTR